MLSFFNTRPFGLPVLVSQCELYGEGLQRKHQTSPLEGAATDSTGQDKTGQQQERKSPIRKVCFVGPKNSRQFVTVTGKANK